jgi:hypothetical protein
MTLETPTLLDFIGLSDPPLCRLENVLYHPWEAIISELPNLICSGRLCDRVDKVNVQAILFLLVLVCSIFCS